jgi:hypothetical protein
VRSFLEKNYYSTKKPFLILLHLIGASKQREKSTHQLSVLHDMKHVSKEVTLGHTTL